MKSTTKTVKIAVIALSGLALTALPYPTLRAEQITDTTKTETKASSPSLTISAKGMTVNGRPATRKEKQVARQMTQQGLRMANKGLQVAGAALTDPKRAERLGEELEAMGDEMERMGDSLEALAEDTVFLYDGDEDSDSLLLTNDDISESVNEFADGINNWLNNTWMGKMLGGGLGLMAAIFGIMIAVIVIALLILVFGAPLWIALLVIWLIVNNDRKKSQRRQQQAYAPAAENAQTDNAQVSHLQDVNTGSRTSTYNGISNAEAENTELWRSGVRMCCMGVGLIVFFIAIHWHGLWGIGALVACIGVSKLIIAYSSRKKAEPYKTYNDSYSHNYGCVDGSDDGSGNSTKNDIATTDYTTDSGSSAYDK